MNLDYTQTKAWIKIRRVEIDNVIKQLKEVLLTKPEKGGREMALAHTKLQEAKMWLGKVLEEIGSELPVEYRDEA